LEKKVLEISSLFIFIQTVIVCFFLLKNQLTSSINFNIYENCPQSLDIYIDTNPNNTCPPPHNDHGTNGYKKAPQSICILLKGIDKNTDTTYSQGEIVCD